MMRDKNLLEETLEILDDYDKTPADVLYVTNGKKSCSWEGFVEKAKGVNYDSGFGGPEIDLSLKVVGDGFWLERGEYDGSEWWVMKTYPPVQPEKGDFDFDTKW